MDHRIGGYIAGKKYCHLNRIKDESKATDIRFVDKGLLEKDQSCILIEADSEEVAVRAEQLFDKHLANLLDKFKEPPPPRAAPQVGPASNVPAAGMGNSAYRSESAGARAAVGPACNTPNQVPLAAPHPRAAAPSRVALGSSASQPSGCCHGEGSAGTAALPGRPGPGGALAAPRLASRHRLGQSGADGQRAGDYKW